MILRQGLNFTAHLLVGTMLGVLAIVAARGRMRRHEPLEPRYPPPAQERPAPASEPVN